MFLGTPRWWWIMTIVVFVAGLVLIGADLGFAFGMPAGIGLIVLAMILFSAAPRKRREEPAPVEQPAPASPEAPPALPRSRPSIEGRDANEV